MKKILLFFFALNNFAFSQLPNYNMELIKNLDTRRVPPQYSPAWHYSACWGYTAPDGREYAILGCIMGTQIVDITDSTNVREVYFRPANINFSNYDEGFGWREMKTYLNYLYVISFADSTGIDIFDLQNLPDSVRYIGKFTIPGHSKTRTISQSGPYLYLNGSNNTFGQGTVIVDITNPELPVRRGSWNNEYVHDSRPVNDTLFTANILTGKLAIFNVANKDSVKFITSFQTLPNPNTHNCAVTKDRKYIFTTDEIVSPPGKLKVWNIENLSDIIYVTTWTPTNIPNAVVHNIEIYGDTAVVAHFLAGIRVLDVSNPENPAEIAWYDTFPSSNTNQFGGCWAVYKFPSGKIIGSDMITGLYVLKLAAPFGIQIISNEVPEKFSLEQNYPNPFNPSTKIKFSIAEQTHVELKIFDVTGREITNLINRRLMAGTYEYEWNASNLPSGVYFYNLTALNSQYGFNYTFTKKMVVVK